MTPDANDPEFVAWEERQSSDLTGDVLWRLDAYRHALFAVSLAKADVNALARDPVCRGIAAQLLTATASISANIAEGYGRPTTPDRIRFFSYALGSAREAFVWYEAAGSHMDEETRARRLARLSRIRRMLLGLLVRLRTKSARRFDSW